jgi:hypothetical protein
MSTRVARFANNETTTRPAKAGVYGEKLLWPRPVNQELFFILTTHVNAIVGSREGHACHSEDTGRNRPMADGGSDPCRRTLCGSWERGEGGLSCRPGCASSTHNKTAGADVRPGPFQIAAVVVAVGGKAALRTGRQKGKFAFTRDTISATSCVRSRRPSRSKDWSLTSLKEKLIKIGAKVVSRGRYIAFQMAGVAVPRHLFADTFRLITELRPPPVTSTA